MPKGVHNGPRGMASADPETGPMRAIFAFVPLAVLETVSVAERKPFAEGVLVTVTVQSAVSSPFSVQVGEPALMSVVALTAAVEPADVAA